MAAALKPAESRRLGWAWVLLCSVLALHVLDETLTDFLSVYNPTALAIRSRIPWLPIPTFTFGVWLAGLMAAVILLLLLSRFAFAGRRWMVWLAYPFGILMFFNGMLHVAGSIRLGRLMPGVYSAPLLLLASAWLLVAARHAGKNSDAYPPPTM